MLTSIEVIVTAVTDIADGIRAWEVRDSNGEPLPAFQAGAHIDLHLSNGLVRSYSLCNSQDECYRYVFAVNKDPQSRGGSNFVHGQLKTGDRLLISPPRNNFLLNETATHSVFIAGGIGITPIWCMIQRLEQFDRSWEIHYSARVRAMCAFRENLLAFEQRAPGRVHFNFDREPGGHVTDLRALLGGLNAEADIYCCGPTPMLQAFEAAVKDAVHKPRAIHLEYFAATEKPALQGGYTVVLQRSGLTLQVLPGKSILDTLIQNDVDAAYSCKEGVCGMCETRVLEGTPDHRDAVLSEEEHESGGTMMICCSGSKGPKLVLDR